MPTRFRDAVRRPSRLILAASLAAVLPIGAWAQRERESISSQPNPALLPYELRLLHGHEKRQTVRSSDPTSVPAMLTVDNCADDGTPGSLRSQIAAAPDGATIDLTQLVCSRISISHAIEVNQPSLNLKGPDPTPGNPPWLTVDANNQSAVFNHFGVGALRITNLNVANGHYSSSIAPTGGCVYSAGTIQLLNSVVSHCSIESTSTTIAARGGGVYASLSLYLYRATITDSHASNESGGDAEGGAAFAAGDVFQAFASTISKSTAYALPSARGSGGGVLAQHNAKIFASTISGNGANYAGGLDLTGAAPYNGTVVASTISNNVGTRSVGGLLASLPTTLANSAVAFNRSPNEIFGYSEGVFFQGPLTVISSIIASNVGPQGLSDLGGILGEQITETNSLITSGVVLPGSGTITACAKLEPLSNNGGATRTHALKMDSPAIDMGAPGNLNFDQRELPRVAGNAADIGAVEMQPGEWDNRIFVDSFDDLCGFLVTAGP